MASAGQTQAIPMYITPLIHFQMASAYARAAGAPGSLGRHRLRLSVRSDAVTLPPSEGTFYLQVRSPWPNDAAFCDLLVGERTYCLPNRVSEMPGSFRISLTANYSMVERARPGFARAMAMAVRAGVPA